MTETKSSRKPTIRHDQEAHDGGTGRMIAKKSARSRLARLVSG
jgi:hypothetical protein